METKKCKTCSVEKDVSEFYLVHGKPTCVCKPCTKERIKKYQEQNKDKVKQWKDKWASENVEKRRKTMRDYANSAKGKEVTRQYREQNSDKRRKYAAEWAAKKRQEDPKYRLDECFSGAIYKHLMCRSISKSGRKWEEIVGYTKEDLCKHLETLFKEGMTWDNYGSYWHIDHITPKSWFNYTSMDDEEFKKCWALDNLQPLEISINLSKGNRYEG